MEAGRQLLEEIKNNLRGSMDVIYQPFIVDGDSFVLIYINSIVKKHELLEYVITPLLQNSEVESEQTVIERIDNGTFFSLVFKRSIEVKVITDAIVSGHAVLYCSGLSYFCLFSIEDFQTRAISESTNEVVVIGPQEAFNENINVNLSMLRHKIKHPDLKTIRYTIGRYTKTTVYLTYIEGICKQEVLDDVRTKLADISIDAIVGTEYLVEMMEDSPFSPFPQCQNSERPDTLAAALLEGRIGIMQDGMPFSLIVPVTFFSMLQSAEDYYQRFYSASWIRLIRLLFTVISFLLPSVYVAVTTFHPEIIPTDLLITIAAARENIPFPALMEGLMMELSFEVLREAGIRIPKPLGQTVSIIGALVVGQAAVLAGIISAPMVIVVSITGIASFIIPHFELGLTFRLLRFPVLILGGTLGLFGIVLALYVIYWHMVGLRSFGTPFMQPIAPIVFKDMKDVLVRAPWFWMKERPQAYAGDNKKRMRSK